MRAPAAAGRPHCIEVKGSTKRDRHRRSHTRASLWGDNGSDASNSGSRDSIFRHVERLLIVMSIMMFPAVAFALVTNLYEIG